MLRILQDCTAPLFLFNEMDICVAWANAAFAQSDAAKVLTLAGDASELYAGPFTEDTAHILDCFCVTLNPAASYPNASTIPVEEFKVSVDSWNVHRNYFYGENNFESFTLIIRRREKPLRGQFGLLYHRYSRIRCLRIQRF